MDGSLNRSPVDEFPCSCGGTHGGAAEGACTRPIQHDLLLLAALVVAPDGIRHFDPFPMSDEQADEECAGFLRRVREEGYASEAAQLGRREASRDPDSYYRAPERVPNANEPML